MMALGDYIAAWPRRFDWTRSHCAHFALGWVQAATGKPALAAIPAVGGALPWARAVRDAGGMRAMVSARLRCEFVPVEAAAPGDLLLYPGGVTGGALGIRLQAGAAVLRNDGAVAVVSAARALCAWPLAGLLPQGEA